jgi:choline dehydrogenase-like flavoprotein
LNVYGLADGVVYIDTDTKEERGVSAPVVVLCASTLESTRMLLNSAYDGLANSSGVLGHYLMDHTYSTGAQGSFPVRNGAKPETARRPNGIYIPRFQNLDGPQEKNFIRGYGFQGGEGITSYQQAYKTVGFGPDFKNQVRDGNTSSLNLTVFGEMLPRYENVAKLDNEVVDAFGIPVLHVSCESGQNEAALTAHGVEQAVAMLEAAGCEDVTPRTTAAPPGFGIHECGTARMGDDPQKSILNKWNQTHDIKNLFVMDGSSFVTISCVNPTLTMMALTVRACEYLIGELKRGNLA